MNLQEDPGTVKKCNKVVRICYECPEYHALINLPWQWLIKQDKFDFPVGFCLELREPISDFSVFLKNCPWEDIKMKCVDEKDLSKEQL